LIDHYYVIFSLNSMQPIQSEFTGLNRIDSLPSKLD
jgi:hypothetical protein